MKATNLCLYSGNVFGPKNRIRTTGMNNKTQISLQFVFCSLASTYRCSHRLDFKNVTALSILNIYSFHRFWASEV